VFNDGDEVGKKIFSVFSHEPFKKKLHNPSTDCYQVALMECHTSCFTVGLFSGDVSQEFHASVYAEIVGRVRFHPFNL
jgi:hypothetical protein